MFLYFISNSLGRKWGSELLDWGGGGGGGGKKKKKKKEGGEGEGKQ